MLKQRPKQFWSMIKAKTSRDIAIPISTFVKFNEEIFYDATIAPSIFEPLDSPAQYHIT
jgi:hypothetical protein